MIISPQKVINSSQLQFMIPTFFRGPMNAPKRCKLSMKYVAGGVTEGQNLPQKWLRSPREANEYVKDPWNGPLMVPPIAPDRFESISVTLDPFRDLYRTPKPNFGCFKTDFDLPWPPSQPGRNIIVRNGLHRCPTHSTTYFLFNLHLLRAF